MIRVTLVVCVTLLWTATVSASCSICGTNKVVGDPNALLSFPGQPTISCGILQVTGTMGLIPKDTCLGLPTMLAAACLCRDVSSSGRFLGQMLRSLQENDDGVTDGWAPVNAPKEESSTDDDGTCAYSGSGIMDMHSCLGTDHLLLCGPFFGSE